MKYSKKLLPIVLCLCVLSGCSSLSLGGKVKETVKDPYSITFKRASNINKDQEDIILAKMFETNKGRDGVEHVKVVDTASGTDYTPYKRVIDINLDFGNDPYKHLFDLPPSSYTVVETRGDKKTVETKKDVNTLKDPFSLSYIRSNAVEKNNLSYVVTKADSKKGYEVAVFERPDYKEMAEVFGMSENKVKEALLNRLNYLKYYLNDEYRLTKKEAVSYEYSSLKLKPKDDKYYIKKHSSITYDYLTKKVLREHSISN